MHVKHTDMLDYREGLKNEVGTDEFDKWKETERAESMQPGEVEAQE